jgi:hypothetical protein
MLAARVSLFATGTWEAVRELDNQAAYTPDGHCLLMRTDSNVLRLVEAQTGRELTRFEIHDLALPGLVRFTPDGATLVSVDDKGDCQLCDLRRLRAELSERGLDWDAPPYPPDPPQRDPIRIQVDWGDYQRLSKLEEVKNYDRAVDAAPQMAVRWHRRGVFHLRAGRHALALADLCKAAELEPQKSVLLPRAGAALCAGAPERP